MKHWLINFSIMYENGKSNEGVVELEAANISEALNNVIDNIQKPSLQDPDITDFVIWNIGIKEDDVF